jgi:phosphohistidine phosphatase
MQILLWRHADAEDGVPDEARALTRLGREQAAQAARWLKDRLPGDFRLLVSPATRAIQTAQALRKHFETTTEVGLSATPGGVIEAIRRHEQDGTVIVVGHQPTLGQVASALLCGSPRDMSFKKSAIWWFTCKDEESALRAVFDPRIG